MIDPAMGPYLFDTSAENWFGQTAGPDGIAWLREYTGRFAVSVSAITIIERVRGYARLWQGAAPELRERIEVARIDYLNRGARVVPVDLAIAIAAGELMATVPQPPTPARRSHRAAESRQGRLSRWRFDQIIAATALVTRMRLIHNNAADFEPLRAAVELAPQRFPGLGPLELVRCTALI